MSDERINNYVNSFFKLGSECNFPGCEHLREQYTMELYENRLKGGCHACYRMGLAKKYKQMIINRIKKESVQ